jgi:hypothetical protein
MIRYLYVPDLSYSMPSTTRVHMKFELKLNFRETFEFGYGVDDIRIAQCTIFMQ